MFAVAFLFSISVPFAAAPPALAQAPATSKTKSPSQSSAQDFNTLSARAAQASQENRLDDAAALYRQALTLHPRWAEGWWSLGTLQYDQNHFSEAARAFQKLIILQPENGTAHAMLGLCQSELHQYDDSLKNLLLAQRQGVQNDPQLQHVVLYQLGTAQLRKRRFGDALVTFTLLLKDNVRSPEVETAMGMSVLTIVPADLPAAGTPGRDVVERVGRAESLAAFKEFATAKPLYELVVNEYPAYPNLHYAFGRFLLSAHETDQAIAEFQKEIANNPKHVGAMLQIAAVRYRVDSAAGVQYALQAVHTEPQLPFAHYLLGLLYLDTDRAAEALPELEIARKAFPQQAQVYFALGNAYARVGQKEQSARMRAEFVRLNAAKPQETGADVYGEQPSGLVNQKLGESAEKPKP